jgi:hypothetical protein
MVDFKRARDAFAWAESPLQVLAIVEYAAIAGVPVRLVPRAGVPQLTATIDRVRQLGLPPNLEILEPRPLPLAGFLLPPERHWIIGDAYSVMAQSLLAMRMPKILTIVDDGAATLGIPAALAGARSLSRSGEPSALAINAARRLTALDATGNLEVFSYYQLDLPSWLPNRFGWLNTRRIPPLDYSRSIVLGTARVIDGLMSEEHFLAWIAHQQPGALYLPHRREPHRLTELVSSLGLAVLRTGLPVELVLAGSHNLQIVSLPSSAADTLRILLAGTGSHIRVSELVDVAA